MLARSSLACDSPAARPSTTVTTAPRSASASAAANPLTPRPATSTLQARPVGVAVGQARARLVVVDVRYLRELGRVAAHDDPTTHSA